MHSHERSSLYPLRFHILSKEKVWGGHRLARLLETDRRASRRRLDSSPRAQCGKQTIGEVWAVWGDLIVANGPLQGHRLDDLVCTHPLPLLGRRFEGKPVPIFPLLVKLIDAQETLSVQVHPDDRYAHQHEGQPFGKAEVWYILDVEPGAQLIHGVREALIPAEVEQAIETGTLQDYLDYVSVEPGDVILNPPGAIHALGGGLLLYELQQSSDLTYRLYDWDRRDPNRPLHIQKSLDVAHLKPFVRHRIDPIEVEEPGGTRTYLCACAYFAAELLKVHSQVQERPAGTCFHILTVLEGTGHLRYGSGSQVDIEIGRGESLLVPACIHEYEVQAGEPLVLIKAYVPDLLADIVQPLRQRGIPDNSIFQLAGTFEGIGHDLASYIGCL